MYEIPRAEMIRAGRAVGFLIALACLGVSFSCTRVTVPDPSVRYVAFGDSTTAGPTERDYPDFLIELLGEDPARMANEGEGGETTPEGLERLSALLSGDVYPQAQVLLYWEGGNDVTDFLREFDGLLLFSPADPDYPFADELAMALDDTQGNIEAAIRVGHDAGFEVFVATYFFLLEEVQLCGALPVGIILPEQARRANVYLEMLNERIRMAAAHESATIVDIAARDELLRSDSSHYHDCNHLSEEGNEIIAVAFLEALQLMME